MYSSNALITESVNILIENLPNKFKQLFAKIRFLFVLIWF